MSRLGRNPFEKNRPAVVVETASAPEPEFTAAATVEKKAPQAIETLTFVEGGVEMPEAQEALESQESDELLELSSFRDFIIKDVPAAALMLAIKGALRWSDRRRQIH